MHIGLIGAVEDRRLMKVMLKGWVRAVRCRQRKDREGGIGVCPLLKCNEYWL